MKRDKVAEAARYYSEPINDEERLEVVMRYVHQEPWRLGMTDSRNDGITETLDEWAWSSWHEYVGLGSDLPIVCEQPGACHNLTVEEWRALLSEPLPEGTKCLEPKEYRAPKPTETQVLSMVRLMTTATNWADRLFAYSAEEIAEKRPDSCNSQEFFLTLHTITRAKSGGVSAMNKLIAFDLRRLCAKNGGK